MTGLAGSTGQMRASPSARRREGMSGDAIGSGSVPSGSLLTARSTTSTKISENRLP